tara:strand:- start:175 stop:498 length:324 start_codon:yes stop_codon:yes gene_type:complete
MILTGKQGGIFLDVKSIQASGTMDGDLKGAINSNAKSMLKYLPVSDAIDLALQTQTVRGLSSETQALIEEKEALQAENRVLADNNAAQAEVRKEQAQKIVNLEAADT